MQQKTALVCAFVLDTPVLFLDEPTLGLDVESVGEMVSFFNQREFFGDRLICVTSHNLDFVRRVVDDVILIKDGRFLDRCEIDALQQQNELVEVLLRNDSDTQAVPVGLPFAVVKQTRSGEYLSLVVEADGRSLAEVVAAVESAGGDVFQVKRLRFDLETIYLLAQTEK